MPKKKVEKKPVLKMTPKIQEFVISHVSGEDCLNLVKYLKGKENVSEFIIARELEEEINIIRNKLYRLLHANLVSFNRKKDKQKGWYIYYWTLNLNPIKFLFYEIKRKRLETLKERMKREENNFFFICENKCIRLDFEQATNFEYRCPECGELLHQEDNTKIMQELKKEIDELEKEVEELKGSW